MNLKFINSLEDKITKTLQIAGGQIKLNNKNIIAKKEDINTNTEILLDDINGLLKELDNKYIKIKHLEDNNKNKDNLDILINNLEYNKSNKVFNNSDSDSEKSDELDIKEYNSNDSKDLQNKIELMKTKIIKNRSPISKNKRKEFLNKVDKIDTNNKKVEKLNILLDKNDDLNEEIKLDTILLMKVIMDMKKIVNLIPDEVEEEQIKDNVLKRMSGGKYEKNRFKDMPNELHKFSNKYSELLNNKSKLKKYVDTICNKYGNTNECINIIFETFETINLTDEQIGKLDFDINEIKNNNVKMLQEKTIELDKLTNNNNNNEKILKQIEEQLISNLKKYNHAYKKYIDINNNIDNIPLEDSNNNIDRILLEYDSINNGLLSKIEELSKDNIDLEVNKNTIKNNINDNKDDIILLHTQITDLKNQLVIIQDANKKRITDFIDKLNKITDEKLLLNNNISKLNNKIKDVEQQLSIYKSTNNDNINNEIHSYKKQLTHYKTMLDDATKWKTQINSQLLYIKTNLQEKIKVFDDVEILLTNLNNINLQNIPNTSTNKNFKFKIKDITTQLDYLNNIKLNNENKLEELNEIINNDDHNVEDTRNKLKEYRNEIAKNIN